MERMAEASRPNLCIPAYHYTMGTIYEAGEAHLILGAEPLKLL